MPSLKFNIQTPGKEDYLDPNETESGGITNLLFFSFEIGTCRDYESQGRRVFNI